MRTVGALIMLLFASLIRADEIGRNIYLNGTDLEGRTIPVYLNEIPSEEPLGCVQCHRESGLGTSESGQTIPPVSWSFLSTVQPPETSRFENIRNRRNAYDFSSFHRMVTTGINSNGATADSLMPRYAMSEAQSRHLVAYLKTLYSNDDPGVDGETIRIATIIDSRLDERSKSQHRMFIKGLFNMKNAKTRGELKRKKFSPIQKAPQYESYRVWELVEWVLPERTEQWQQSLQENYAQSPVFVVLAPNLKSDSEMVTEFCTRNRLPCLFPLGDEIDGGDFYNYVFRNSDKQIKDFVAGQRRKQGDRLFKAQADGSIEAVIKTDKVLQLLSSSGVARFRREYQRICGEPGKILVQADGEVGALLQDLQCAKAGLIRLVIVADSSMDYLSIKNLIDNGDSTNVCWATDYSQVLKRNSRQIRVSVLTSKFGINDPKNEMLAKLLFGYGVLTDALHQLAGTFSRVYMLEIIEHMLNSFPNYTYFDDVTGAPYQRSVVGPYSEYCTDSLEVKS